jgi:hypothetical protein
MKQFANAAPQKKAAANQNNDKNPLSNAKQRHMDPVHDFANTYWKLWRRNGRPDGHP